jgi:hypothetical protein
MPVRGAPALHGFVVTPVCSRRTPPFFRVTAALVDTNERASRDIGAMEEWATDCGVQRAPGFQLTTQDGIDWSFVATEPLAEDTTLLAVPGSMIFSSNQARQEFYSEAAEDLLDRLGTAGKIPQFYLVLNILTEYERGDESPWFPWLNSLPRWFNNGAAMTPYCYECLPPLSASLAMQKRVQYIHFKNALQQVNFISQETKSNDHLTKWAYNVVITRSFETNDGDLKIVPLADMLNHGTETDVEFAYNDQGDCYVYTTREVPEGSPLRMSYGDPTNPSQLFATYGFLDETSPATFCKIMNIKPTPELRDLGLDFSRMLFYKDTGDASEEVWDVLLYQILESNRNVQKAFYDAHMTGDASTKNAIHQQYFEQTSRALKNHVDTFLQQLDELSEKALAKDLNEHPRIPLILRHNDFVRETFLTVKDRIDPMVLESAGGDW